MGINMIRTAIAVREEYTYFFSDDYKFFENKIEDGTSLNSTNDSVDPYAYHVLEN